MKAKQVMLCNPATVRPDNTISEVGKLFLKADVNCAPVVDYKGNVVGIITSSKILSCLLYDIPKEEKIEAYMDDPPGIISEDTDLEYIAQIPEMERLLVIDQNNRLSGILSKVELIKRVYRSWEETKNELNVVLQSVSHAIIAYDSGGHIYLFNKGAEKLLGLRTQEVTGKPIAEIVPFQGWKEVLKGTPRLGFKIEINGRHVAANATPIMSGRAVVGAVIVLQDLSEMENLILELSRVRELKDQLDNIIESSYDGIIVVDSQQKVLRANRSALELIQETCSPCVSLNELNSELAHQLADMVKIIKISKQSSTRACILQSGQEVVITGNPCFDNENQLVQVIFNLRDMTELNCLKSQVAQVEEEKQRFSEELKELRSKILTDKIITKSPAMYSVMELVVRVSKVDSTVLITGESGVGKEVVAKTIHSLSDRQGGPFITVNCGAIPETLLESELFGYEKGAFTGARKTGKIGLMEAADGGTLFLDEIGELPLNLQVKLLRALQDKVIYRVGGVEPVKLNVRIIAATNRNLKEMVARQEFREDLFYRLNVVQIEIPPLRKRPEDIVPLANHFLAKYNSQYGKNKVISPEVYKIFERYSWPGNVRELENIVERAVILSQGEVIDASHLPEHLGQGEKNAQTVEIRIKEIVSWQEGLELMEKALLKKALEKGMSTRQTAELLGITHTTVIRKRKHYDL